MGGNGKPLVAWSVHLAQGIAILALITPLMPIAITVFPSASAQSSLEPIYLLRIVVGSTSGWTTVSIGGITSFMQRTSLLSGAEIAGFSYSSRSGYVTMGRSTYLDETLGAIEVLCLSFRGNRSGQVSISKGNNGYTGVTVYEYSCGSWVQLASFINTGTNPEFPGINTRSFTINYDQMYASPSSSASIEPVPPNIRRSVLAFYYPWYLTPKGPSGELYHCDSGYAHEPLIGRYDSMDERVIEAHIRMAKAAGIDGFILNYNGIGQKDERAVPTILKIADSLDFSISFYECTDRPYLSSNDVVNELSHIVGTYSSHKSFLKSDGAPVIFVYAIGAGDRKLSFWLDVVQGVKGRSGPIYLVGDLSLPPDPESAEAFDGLHWYGSPDTLTASQAFGVFEQSMRLGLKDMAWDEAIGLILQGKSITLKEKFLAFTVEPGYDHTKIGGTEYLDRRDGKTYEEFWNTALSRNPDGILITSWNEWHEGSEIEPSMDYGFNYLNLTRKYTSLYKGTEQPIDSTALRIQTDLGNVVRYGMRNATFWVINDSPNTQATCVNLSISLSERLNLTRANHSAFYSYIETQKSHAYDVAIPLLEPHESISLSITFTALVGMEKLTVTAEGNSPSGVITTYSAEREVQVLYDRVIIDLDASTSRVEIGSEAPLITRAYYEYDHQPFSGMIYLNDSLTKNSEGAYHYTASHISDNLYGLTGFTSNTVSITFDRMIMNPTIETTSLGSIRVIARLSFEFDGQPVDQATVTVNSVPTAENSPGTFQTTVYTWSPLYQLNVTIERPGFSPQNIVVSGYAIGNMLVDIAIVAILGVFVILLMRRIYRKAS